uniref:Uncharacterized protein n=1 Tax=Naja naja TaxID=35670 RepID=A0A8C6YIH1_NAJNA
GEAGRRLESPWIEGLKLSPPFHPFPFVLKNYGENPEDYNEELKKLEQLRQVRFPYGIPRLARSLSLA